VSVGPPRATILHADLDSFYASVEQRDAPDLRGRPVAVGMGVVLAASYEAKAMGVSTPMAERDARRRCPGLVVRRPRFEAYAQASRQVFDIFHDTTPLVEGLSVDEAFLDVGGLWRIAGPPVEIAQRLRGRVAHEVGLAISVGVARTKFLAKVASGVAKPDGLLTVDPEDELGFLHPLPVEKLWGVGRVTAAKLAARGLSTVGDVAALDGDVLVAMLGRASGRHLHALAHNRDPRPVEVGRRRRSIGAQQALGWRPTSRDDLGTVLLRLVDRVARRMRRADRIGRTVTVRFRFDDLSRATRSHSLPHRTDSTRTLSTVAAALLRRMDAEIEERGITLLGVSVGDLVDRGAQQLSLPFGHAETAELDEALDAVRDRFGSSAIGLAASVGSDAGFTVPLLPD